MLNGNSQMMNKRLSYSQMLLKNLKRKMDETEEQNKTETNNININNTNEIRSLKDISVLTNKTITPSENNVIGKKKVTPVLQQVTNNNIDDLRKVYLSTFPLQYNSEFYRDILNEYPKALSRVVGGICCRLEKKTLKDIRQNMTTTVNNDFSFAQQINNLKLLNTYSCYIMAIAVLDLYQDLSI
ncbi:hypothetical protein PIROE2DRAFT_15059, partial [Piromyces sp. E2]